MEIEKGKRGRYMREKERELMEMNRGETESGGNRSRVDGSTKWPEWCLCWHVLSMQDGYVEAFCLDQSLVLAVLMAKSWLESVAMSCLKISGFAG